MKINSQRIDFKLESFGDKYSRKLEENLQVSRETFCDIETPGWTSLMRSEISERTKRTQAQKQIITDRQADIYQKLNSLSKLDWSDKDQKKMFIKIDDNTNSRKQSQYREQDQRKKSEEKCKRWNQISVHEHLYQNSQKMENKKMINKLLDEEFKKKQIYKFTPTINKKSIQLAEMKFSRANQNVDQLVIQEKPEETIQTETSIKFKKDRNVERYRLLNKTFYFLSQSNPLLGQGSLHDTAVLLPLPCLKVIQPIVSRVYQGEKMEWLDFLEAFNDKQVKGKEGFYTLMAKWFTRNEEKNVGQNSTKQNLDHTLVSTKRKASQMDRS